jgi:hypothetical protein
MALFRKEVVELDPTLIPGAHPMTHRKALEIPLMKIVYHNKGKTDPKNLGAGYEGMNFFSRPLVPIPGRAPPRRPVGLLTEIVAQGQHARA